MDRHDVGFVKGLRAVRTFPHAIGETIINTVVAESVTASLDSCILEVLTTDGAQGECLTVLAMQYKLREKIRTRSISSSPD